MMVYEKCICCGMEYPEEDIIDFNNKGMCSSCTIGFIKSNICGGLDCADLLQYIKNVRECL